MCVCVWLACFFLLLTQNKRAPYVLHLTFYMPFLVIKIINIFTIVVRYASGVGVFELHINGAKVGDHFLDPGEAVYDQKVLFVGFNVTKLLRPSATNAIGARIGNSKW